MSANQYAARQRDAKHKAKVIKKLADEAVELEQVDKDLSMMRQELIKAASQREAELDAREDVLEVKERALLRRAAALDAREEDLQNAVGAMNEIMEGVEQGEAVGSDGLVSLPLDLPFLSRFQAMLQKGAVRCLIPRFDGVILSREWKDALWDKFVMEAPRLRTLSEQQYSDRKLRSRS